MTRRATVRLPVAVVVTVVGALFAVLGGMPEAALLAAPWAVLLALGISGSGPDRSTTAVEIVNDRVLVGDDVEMITSLKGVTGSVGLTCLPSAGFWPPDNGDHVHEAARARDVVVSNRAQIRCLLPATQWGMHEVGRAHVEVTEPYGLFRWQGEVGEPKQVRVHPRPTELQNLLAPWLVRRVAGAHRSNTVGRGVEYADIRPHAAGDTLRDINWRASARSPEVWVSQRHPDQATDVILMLDSFVESGHDVHTVVGLAIEAAVALAESHLAVTDRVGLIELGGMVRWVNPGTGRIQLQRLVDGLLSTGLYSHVADRNLNAIMARGLPPRSFVVALTPLLDDRFIEALFILAGHGHDVAVIECDAILADVGAMTAAKVARQFWEADRQVVRDRLAEHGVSVASWSAGGQLDRTLDELTRRRQRTVRAIRR